MATKKKPTPAPVTPKKPPVDRTKRAFTLHGRMGLLAGLPLAFIMLTGALAIYGRELDALWYPSSLCAHAHRGQIDVPWSMLQESATHAVPTSRLLWIMAPEQDGASACALVETEAHAYRHVFLDPQNGRALGIAPFRTPHRFLRDLHRDWLLGEDVGLVLVTSFSLALVFSIVTGLFFWTRRITGDGLRRYHRIMSIALLPFTLVVVVTTLWYWGENLAGSLDLRPSGSIPHVAAADVSRVRRHEPTMSIDRLVSHAHDTFPELQIRSIAMPTPRRPVFSVSGHANEGPLVRELANQVFVHPYNGDVLEVHRATQLGPLAWWEHAVDAIHFGTWGSMWGGASGTRALWCVLGVVSALVPLSGWIVRRRRASAK